MNTLTWLHLSDFHFSEKLHGDQKSVLSKLLSDLELQIKNNDLHIDLVFITGDIAFSGKESEYNAANNFFEAFLNKLKLSREQVYMVPGNHDSCWNLVDAKDVKAALKLKKNEDPNEVKNLLRSNDERERYFRRQIHFRTFSSQWSNPKAIIDKSQAWFVVKAPFEGALPGGLEIWIVGLNSSWLSWHKKSGWQDQGSLIIGQEQVLDAFGKIGIDPSKNPFIQSFESDQFHKTPITIVLTHHPLSYLADFDQSLVRSELVAKADFHLRGHLHKNDIGMSLSPSHRLMEIAGGASFSEYNWRNGYNIVSLNFARRTGKIWLRTWTPNDGGFWTEDNDLYKEAPRGQWEWALDTHKQIDSSLACITSLKPCQFVTSPRLEKAASDIRELIEKDKKIIALRGSPGDGKTQVARNLAEQIEDGAYIILPYSVDGEYTNSWYNGISMLLHILTGVRHYPKNPDKLFQVARDEIAKANINMVLIIDNAENEPPISIRNILRADSNVRCVVVGPGITDVDSEYTLRSPTGEEFIQIVIDSSDDWPEFIDEQKEILLNIAEITSNSPLVAKCVAAYCSLSLLTTDLKDFHKTIQENQFLNTEQVIIQAIQKCWTALSIEEQKRLLFVAALGQPEIPQSWFPSSILTEGPKGWKMLDRAGAATRQEGGLDVTIRIHRMVSSWVYNNANIDMSSEVASTLLGWLESRTFRDDLKSNSVMSWAFIEGCKYLFLKDAIDKFEIIQQTHLLKNYIDILSSVSNDQQYLERHLNKIIPNPDVLENFSPAVLGELIDSLRPNIVKGCTYLEKLKDNAASHLTSHFEKNRLKTRFYNDEQWIEVSGAHHLAKYLIKAGSVTLNMDSLINILRQIDSICQEAISISSRKSRWFIQRAATRLQICRAKSEIEATERANLLLEVLRSSEELPDYLHLDVIKTLLEIHDVSNSVISDDHRKSLPRERIIFVLDKKHR